MPVVIISLPEDDAESVADLTRRILRPGEALAPAAPRPRAEPLTVVPAAPAESASMAAFDARVAKVRQGQEVFAKLVSDWMQGFEIEGAVQPPRDERLMAVFSGYGAAVSAYIREQGGICRAVIDCLLKLGIVPADKAVRLGKKVGGHMVQVGTALALPIDRFMERSMYTNAEHVAGDELPFGGPISDSIDFNRPDINTLALGRGA